MNFYVFYLSACWPSAHSTMYIEIVEAPKDPEVKHCAYRKTFDYYTDLEFRLFTILGLRESIYGVLISSDS